MKTLNEKSMVKIPILSDEEIIELGQIMHYQREDELAKKRFWKKIYEKRGLKYNK